MSQQAKTQDMIDAGLVGIGQTNIYRHALSALCVRLSEVITVLREEGHGNTADFLEEALAKEIVNAGDILKGTAITPGIDTGARK